MGLEQRLTVIENLPPKKKNGVALTAVRRGDDKYVVSTIPYWDEEGYFETGITELRGYLIQGRIAVLNPSWRDETTHIEIYRGSADDALSHHKNTVDGLATVLEAGSNDVPILGQLRE